MDEEKLRRIHIVVNFKNINNMEEIQKAYGQKRSSQNKMTYINLRIFWSDTGSKKEVTTVREKNLNMAFMLLIIIIEQLYNHNSQTPFIDYAGYKIINLCISHGGTFIARTKSNFFQQIKFGERPSLNVFLFLVLGDAFLDNPSYFSAF